MTQDQPTSEFAGRLVLITGGGSGIGAACARAFHDVGARVAIMGRTQAKLDAVAAELSRTMDGAERVRTIAVDVADDDAVLASVDHLRRQWGPIHHLVNSAADFVAAGLHATRAQWEHSLGVNVIGSARLTAAVAATMPPGSTIVNISSISAHVAQPERWTYNTTKAAIVELTRCQAMDLAVAGIRVNVVSPGWIWTPEVEKAAVGGRAEWEPQWGAFHMLGRLGEAEEVAAPVLFLSGGGASFITGAELMVDGGYRAMGPEGMGTGSRFAGSD